MSTQEMPPMPRVPTITPQAAHEEMESSNPLVVDVRPSEEYAAAHIEGALSIPLNEIQTLTSELLTDKNARILVYCNVGYMATFAVEYLMEQGYSNVASFGGIEQWIYGVKR